MNRWLFLIAVAALWGCTDETSPGTTSGTTTTTSVTTSTTSGTGGSGGEGGASTTTSTTGSGGGGGAGGSAPTELTACLDSFDVLMMPPDGTLPCEYIPPGVKLTQ